MPSSTNAVRLLKQDHKKVEEHHLVKLALPEIGDTDGSSEPFAAKAKVLKELVLHHAWEEERDMFPEAQRVLSEDELDTLGARMIARKGEMMRRGKGR